MDGVISRAHDGFATAVQAVVNVRRPHARREEKQLVRQKVEGNNEESERIRQCLIRGVYARHNICIYIYRSKQRSRTQIEGSCENHDIPASVSIFVRVLTTRSVRIDDESQIIPPRTHYAPEVCRQPGGRRGRRRARACFPCCTHGGRSGGICSPT